MPMYIGAIDYDVITSLIAVLSRIKLPAADLCRAGFNWWEAWGPVYLGGTERLQQLYD